MKINSLLRWIATCAVFGAPLACAPTARATTFASGADPEYVHAVQSRIQQSQTPSTGERFTRNGVTRFRIFPGGTIRNGTRRMQLFWSYLPDGTSIENTPVTGQTIDPPIGDPGSQSKIYARLGSAAPVGFGSQRAWQQIVSDAFDRWQAVSGVFFSFVGGAPVADDANPDSGDRWDQNAPGYPTPETAGMGDIRIAMRRLDGRATPGGGVGSVLAFTYDNTQAPAGDAIDITQDPVVPNFGYLGNIVLDEDELWNDPLVPNLFATVIAREIGFALGLNPACPTNPIAPFALMEHQVLAPINQSEAYPQLFFQEPQQDDILAVQYIYGDPLEDNNSYSLATDITYAPDPGSNEFVYAPHLINQPFGRPVQMSISGSGPQLVAPDVDRFRIGVPDSVASATMTITVQPVGTPYIDGLWDPQAGNCSPLTSAVDPRTVQNLRIRFEAFDPFTNILQLIATEDATVAGQPETLELPVSPGIYYISVQGDGADNVQLYNITVRIETPLTLVGEDFLPVLGALGINAFDAIGVFGGNASLGSVDGQHVSDAHSVFSGRSIARVSWPGIQPAVTSAGSHPTTVGAVAGGSDVGTFRGVAPDAELVSAAVASEVFEDGTFSVGKNALYYALFALTNKSLAQNSGLAGPVSVVASSFGGGGRTRDGEDAVSQAVDAAAFMNLATIVQAAGNDGQAERQSFPNCVRLADARAPGGVYLGSRSVVPPATAFNVISVGAVGTSDGSTFDIIPNFSSKGPIDSAANDGQNTSIDDARAGIDIVAPGTGVVQVSADFTPPNGQPLDPCGYVGHVPLTFLNLPGIEPGDDPDNPADPGFFGPAEGTSVAAGIVAGTAALLVDAANQVDPPISTHPAVLKAILLNGAIKLEGWSNNPAAIPAKPQDNRDGANPGTAGIVIGGSVRPLDLAQGAGLVDLQRSLENYLTGYPPATPPQGNFAGPTIDPAVTDPNVPSMRKPPEPSGSGVPVNRASTAVEEGPSPIPPSSIDLMRLKYRTYSPDPGDFSGRSLQNGREDPDLKDGHGPPGTGFTTGPQTPFELPDLGGGGGGSGGGDGPPGSVDPGVRPKEIDAIFVDPIGWDLANIDQRAVRQPDGNSIVTGYIDYIINVPLLTTRPDPRNPNVNLDPDQLTVTLTWLRTLRLKETNFANPNNPKIGEVDALELENLDLFIYAADGLGNPVGDPINSSVSVAGNVEHISFSIPLSGIYLIRVQWIGTLYDVMNKLPLAEQPYGLAWRVDFSPRPEAGRPFGINQLMRTLRSFGGQIGGPGAYDIGGDATMDGRIDFLDIRTILTNWNPSAEGP